MDTGTQCGFALVRGAGFRAAAGGGGASWRTRHASRRSSDALRSISASRFLAESLVAYGHADERQETARREAAMVLAEGLLAFSGQAETRQEARRRLGGSRAQSAGPYRRPTPTGTGPYRRPTPSGYPTRAEQRELRDFSNAVSEPGSLRLDLVGW